MTSKTTQTKSGDNLGLISLILGIVSLAGPGFILGIPAIVLAAIALKRKADNQNFGVVGLVTGIVSTVISLLFVAFVVWIIAWGINHPAELEQLQYQPYSDDVLFDSRA